MMRKQIQNIQRRAFTMIELVMVIVILGIVSMIATDIIANMYKGYIQTKIVNDLESKTEMVINQVAKRLNYRVKPSMIARNSATNAYLSINSSDLNNSNYDMVEWIGYDYESFLGEHNGTFSVPGWSGFIDVNSSDTNNTDRTLKTPGSDLNIADRTMQALSNGRVGLTGAVTHKPAVVFKCPQNDSNLSFYGWDGVNSLNDHNYTLAVTKIAGPDIDILQIDANQADVNRSICEQYYLAWSAYAIVPENSPTDDDFNLTLRYNYQPWYGDDYTDGNSTLLAEHVSTFRVMQVGETLRIKVCIQDGNITGVPVGFCKEKAIF